MLIVVLWVLGLVSLAMGALVMESNHELRLGHVPLDLVQRQAIAQAGVQQAIRIVRQDTEQSPAVDSLQEPWATGQVDQQTQAFAGIHVGRGEFSVGRMRDGLFEPGLIDEERKLNLNTASADHLTRLIELVQPGVDAPAVAAAMIDWRDEAAGPVCPAPPDLTCHNGAFDSVEELRLVPNMTAELFTALQPYVTIYGSGQVNVNTASAIVLNAMGYPGEAIVEQRATQPFESYDGLAVTSTAFTVPVEAAVAHSSLTVSVAAVIDRAGCGQNPPPDARCILAWSVK